MSNIFDLFDLTRQADAPRPQRDALDTLRRNTQLMEREWGASSATNNILSTAASRHAQRISITHARRANDSLNHAERQGDLRQPPPDPAIADDAEPMTSLIT